MNNYEFLLTFYFYQDKNSLRILSENQSDELKEEEKKLFVKYDICIRCLNWCESNDISDSCYRKDEDLGVMMFDSSEYSRQKLNHIVKEISKTDYDGNVTQLKFKDVENLNSLVAEYILDRYSEKYELSDEKRKRILTNVRAYYLSQHGLDTNKVNTPRQILEIAFFEKYGWTPEEVDNIPKFKMDEMMLVMNQKLNVEEEVKIRTKLNKKVDKTKQAKTIGSN